MADLPPSDGVPTWMVAVGSVLSTILTWQAWKPLGGWLAKRLDVQQRTAAGERTNHVGHLVAELKAARDEMLELRKDVGEERELRMALAIENAELRRDVDHLSKAIAEDKRECQEAIRTLRTEIRRLQNQRAAGGGPG